MHDIYHTNQLSAIQTTLTIAVEAVDGIPAPGLKAALGGLLAVVKTVSVRDLCCLSYFSSDVLI